MSMITAVFAVHAKIFKVIKGQISLRKYVKKFQRILIQVDIQLANLSANIIQFEKEVDKLLLRGRVPPKRFRRWVEEAKQVEGMASQALQIRKEKNGSGSLDYETLRNLHFRIIRLLQNSPCRDGRKYDKLIHGRENAYGHMSFSVTISEEKGWHKDSRVKRTKSEQLQDVADPVKPSGGEMKKAEAISLGIDEGMAKINDQGKIPVELISPQEDEAMLSMEGLKAMSTSSEFKDQQQYQGDDILNSSHLAKGSELRSQIEIEEQEITDAYRTDGNTGRMSLPEHFQGQHESPQFPDTAIPSMPATSSDMKSKMTDLEMESTSPLEPVKIESIPLASEVQLRAERGQTATELKIESTPVSEVELEAETGQAAAELKIQSCLSVPEVEPEPEPGRGQTATELKIESIPSISEVEPEPRRGEIATELKLESIPSVSEVEPEAERGQPATELKIEPTPVSEVELEAETGQAAAELKDQYVLSVPEVEPEPGRGQTATELKIESIPSISEVEPEPGRGARATELNIESIPSLSVVEPEADRGQTATELKMSMDSTLSVNIAVSGELSNYIYLIFETLHGFSSSKGQNAVNEFKYCDFTSEADNYCILMKEKTRKMEVDQSKALEGDISSSDLPECSQNPSIKLPEHLILKPGGDMLTISPKEEKWRQTGVMILRDSAFPYLPQKPDCPNLVLLFLQRNRLLRKIPEPFFSCMHSLRVVDLSNNRMSCLPPSLFGLHDLQVLILCNCMFLNELSDEIKGLVHLEVLDLSGTELNKAPDEIGHLTHMRNLQLTFYGTDNESEYFHLPRDFLSCNILSNLQSLQALGIVVHPEDVRWIRNAEAIMRDVGNLKSLCDLEFYFPRVEILKEFIDMSPSWPKISFNKFKFVVGQNVTRFTDRVPKDVEVKFNEQKRCMRFVNGADAPEAVKEVLKCVTAFYLDHHQVIQSLSELGITISEEIKFCIVRECPEVEVIIRDDGNVKPVYPSLEHLGMYYLWKLESISTEHPPEGSFRCLKSLVVHTCPTLEFILYESMLHFLHNLEELVVEDCEKMREIIRGGDGEVNDCTSALPHKLSKIKLYYLPQLQTLWWKLEANLKDPKPEEKLEVFVTVYSCPKLDKSLLESVFKVKKLDSETVFQDEDAVR